jgi:Tol biopolymer transport system component
MSQESMNVVRQVVPVHRRHALVALALALASLAAIAPAANASFPGRNGLIAFAREGPPFDLTPPVTGAQTIWLADPRSGQTRQITRPSRRCGRSEAWRWSDSHPSFSASGRLLTYFHYDGCDPRVADGIFVMRVDGTGRRLIRRADDFEILEFPAFSPSGRKVAFTALDDSTQIISVPRAGERPVGTCDRRCTEVDFPRYFEALHPAWSSGGKLAFTLTGFEGEEDTGHIGIARPGNVDRASVSRLATRSKRDAMPDWSPNEHRLVFHREKSTRRDLKGDVLTALSRGKHRRPRRLTDTRDAFFPAWSPSGRKIAYVRGEWEEPNGTLWIMRAADGRRKRLLATGVYTSRISWQPRPRR